MPSGLSKRGKQHLGHAGMQLASQFTTMDPTAHAGHTIPLAILPAGLSYSIPGFQQCPVSRLPRAPFSRNLAARPPRDRDSTIVLHNSVITSPPMLLGLFPLMQSILYLLLRML